MQQDKLSKLPAELIIKIFDYLAIIDPNIDPKETKHPRTDINNLGLANKVLHNISLDSSLPLNAFAPTEIFSLEAENHFWQREKYFYSVALSPTGEWLAANTQPQLLPSKKKLNTSGLCLYRRIGVRYKQWPIQFAKCDVIIKLAFSSDGEWLIIAYKGEGQYRISCYQLRGNNWQMQSLIKPPFNIASYNIPFYHISADSQWLGAAVHDRPLVYLWRLQQGKWQEQRPFDPKIPNSSFAGFCNCPDASGGPLLLIKGDKNELGKRSLFLYQWRSNENWHSYSTFTEYLREVKCAHTGQWIASLIPPGSLSLWRWKDQDWQPTGSMLQNIDFFGFSNNGQLLTINRFDRNVTLWYRYTNGWLKRGSFRLNAYLSTSDVTYSEDGQWLAVSSCDNKKIQVYQFVSPQNW